MLYGWQIRVSTLGIKSECGGFSVLTETGRCSSGPVPANLGTLPGGTGVPAPQRPAGSSARPDCQPRPGLPRFLRRPASAPKPPPEASAVAKATALQGGLGDRQVGRGIRNCAPKLRRPCPSSESIPVLRGRKMAFRSPTSVTSGHFSNHSQPFSDRARPNPPFPVGVASVPRKGPAAARVPVRLPRLFSKLVSGSRRGRWGCRLPARGYAPGNTAVKGALRVRRGCMPPLLPRALLV